MQQLEIDFNILFELNKNKPTISDILILRNKNQTLFCLIHKEFDADNGDYEIIWELLNKLHDVCENLTIDSINILQLKDKSKIKWEKIRIAIRYIFKNISVNLTTDELKIITDNDKINEILKHYHDSFIGGHQGVNRTYARLKLQYYWENMRKTIKSYIKKCESCQKNKAMKQSRAPMVINSVASKPFERVYRWPNNSH